MNRAKVALGRRLFYDKRLSRNESYSCGSCHEQRLAFTDGRATAVGSTMKVHPRASMSLANVAYATTLTWANPLMTQLERQAHTPIFGDAPVELGMRSPAEAEERFRALPEYEPLFRAAFPNDTVPVSLLNLTRALAAFQRTLLSGRSPLDRFEQGDSSAISDAAQRGLVLFHSERLACASCHRGLAFSDHVTWEGQPSEAPRYHSTGLYDLDGQGSYPEPNTGVYNVTLAPADMGMFKVPTLRNIALTAPYMHDGSIATLSEVLDHYAAGGRAHSPRTDPLLKGFTLSADERADLLAFFETLTDHEFITNPAFSDPFAADGELD